MTQPQPNPEPTISELFARDPFTLTRDGPEIEQMVEHFRKSRAQFKLSDQPGTRAKTPAKPKLSKEQVSAALSNLELDI